MDARETGSESIFKALGVNTSSFNETPAQTQDKPENDQTETKKPVTSEKKEEDKKTEKKNPPKKKAAQDKSKTAPVRKAAPPKQDPAEQPKEEEKRPPYRTTFVIPAETYDELIGVLAELSVQRKKRVTLTAYLAEVVKEDLVRRKKGR